MPYYVDALLFGFSWTGTTGSPATVNYNLGQSYFSDTTPLSGSQQTIAFSALQHFSNIANITFNQVGSWSAADLTFSNYQLNYLGSNVTGYTYLEGSSSTVTRAEVILDTDNTANFGYGPNSFGYLTMLHEIGHSMGLKHPHDGSPMLPTGEDSRDNTIMSYNAGQYTQYVHPSTLMVYDIAALQYLYGANTSYHSGNDNYVYSGALYAGTIWDGGGRDTMNASNQSVGVRIDLFEGTGHTSIIGNSYVWIAYNAQIEDAFGGNGNDTIIGNALSNILYGRGGSDSIYGGIGSDTILGGITGNDASDPADLIYGGNGTDLIYGNGGNDTLYGGGGVADTTEGADTFYGGEGADAIYGNGGADSIFGGLFYDDGGDGANVIDGESGNDIIYGAGGNDTLRGGAGLDSIYGGGGNDSLLGDPDSSDPANADLINGDAGNDVIYGFSGGDLLYGSTGLDTVYGGQGNDTVYGNPDNDLLYGNEGNDSGFGGLGNDTVYGGNDSVDSGDGDDTLYGNAGDDWLYGSGGNDTLYGDQGASDAGDDGADVLFGGLGNDVLYGGGGADVLIGREGNDQMFGGSGNDRFNFTSGCGQDTITGFENAGAAAGDLIVLLSNLNGSGILTGADAIAHTSYAGGNAIIDLGGGNTLTLIGIAPGTLDASDFLIAS